jgi:hypothetical protein
MLDQRLSTCDIIVLLVCLISLTVNKSRHGCEFQYCRPQDSRAIVHDKEHQCQLPGLLDIKQIR